MKTITTKEMVDDIRHAMEMYPECDAIQHMVYVHKDLLTSLRIAASSLSDLIEWQEGNDQPLDEWPTWIRQAKIALADTSKTIAKAMRVSK